MKHLPKISDSEWEVMNIIWETSPLTTSEIMEKLPSERNWKLTTVKTFLDRLTQKGALDFEIRGGRYFYRPKVSQQQCMRKESKSFLNRVFNGDAAPMLMQFVKEAKLSRGEIQELRKILTKKEEGI